MRWRGVNPGDDMANRGGRFGCWVSCAMASVLLHATLLAVGASVRVTPPMRTLEIVRVFLRGGGSAGVGGGQARHAPASAPPPVIAAPPAAPVPAQPPVEVSRPHTAKIARPQKPARPQPTPVRAVESDRAVAAIPRDAAPAVGTAAPPGGTSGTGGGSGGGSESGRGAGAGDGTGSGLGFGEGTDQRAYCVFCPEPGYPLLARRRGWKGTVDVGLVLLADGRVERATVRRSSGFEVLDQEALEVARRSRFLLPAHTVAPVAGRIEYRFELLPGR